MPRLPLVIQEVPVERLTLSLKASVTEALREYRAYYEEAIGGKVQLNYMLEEIIKSCMSDDKDFQKHLKKPTSKVAAPRARDREDDGVVVAPADSETDLTDTTGHANTTSFTR